MPQTTGNRIVEAFEHEIDKGVYTKTSGHSERKLAFFNQIFVDHVGRLNESLDILECGAGAGFWLEAVSRSYPKARLFGFDLTPKMVTLAGGRLESEFDRVFLKAGNILDDASYVFVDNSSGTDAFDVIYCYDVIQQLPVRFRLQAIEKMLSKLRKNGRLIVFDNERWSVFGIKMYIKKAITKHLGIQLVPSFNCLADYPSLYFLQKRARSLGLRGRLVKSQDNKRALVLQR